MVAEETKIDKGAMTQSEKKAEILSVIKDLKNKWLYTLKLVEKFHEDGFDQMDAFSFYTNYVCRERLPKEKIKINIQHDFTKDYKEPEPKQTELDGVGGQAPREHRALLHNRDDIKGAGQDEPDGPTKPEHLKNI